MAEKKYSGMAIASFVLGLCGLPLYFLFVPSILAIIFGSIGVKRIKRNKSIRGKALAWWGIWLGIVPLALMAIGIIWVVIINLGASG